MKKKNWQEQNGNVHEGHMLAEHKDGDVIACEKCGFSHIIPLPDPEDLEKFYEEEFYQNEKPDYLSSISKDKEWMDLTYGDRFEIFENSLGRNGSILDIGCGPGGFLLTGKKRGWECVGIEPSKHAADFASKQGLTIKNRFFSKEVSHEIGQFDVVHMSEVLEHVLNPSETLQLAKTCLKSKGLIAISVPNDFNPLQKCLVNKESHIPWWVVPTHHISYFNFETLEKLLVKNGFCIKHRTTNFPMELFLLMGDDYTKDPELGSKLHEKRKKFELSLDNFGDKGIRQNFYKALAQSGFGRLAIIIAQKNN